MFTYDTGSGQDNVFNEGQPFARFREIFLYSTTSMHYKDPIPLVKILSQDTAMVGDRTHATGNALRKDW